MSVRMHSVLAIDPATHELGLARLNEHGRLVDVDLLRAGDTVEMLGLLRTKLEKMPSHDVRLVELPQVYNRHASKGDPNALIQVACIAGAAAGIAMRQTSTILRTPAEWKGQASKEMTIKRASRALSFEEHSLMDSALQRMPSKLRHNAEDAVSLAVYYREGWFV